MVRTGIARSLLTIAIAAGIALPAVLAAPPAAPDDRSASLVAPSVELPGAPFGADAVAAGPADDVAREAGALQAAVGDAASAWTRQALLATPVKIWTSINDGAGSGLDADALLGRDGREVLDDVESLKTARVAVEKALADGLSAERAATESADARLEDLVSIEEAARVAQVDDVLGRIDDEVAALLDAIEGEAGKRNVDVSQLREALLEADRAAQGLRVTLEEQARSLDDLDVGLRSARADLEVERSLRELADSLEEAARVAADDDLDLRLDELLATLADRVVEILRGMDGPLGDVIRSLLDGTNVMRLPPFQHTHDERYYTREESDARFLRLGGITSFSGSANDPSGVSKVRVVMKDADDHLCFATSMTTHDVNSNGTGHTSWFAVTLAPVGARTTWVLDVSNAGPPGTATYAHAHCVQLANVG